MTCYVYYYNLNQFKLFMEICKQKKGKKKPLKKFVLFSINLD